MGLVAAGVVAETAKGMKVRQEELVEVLAAAEDPRCLQAVKGP